MFLAIARSRAHKALDAVGQLGFATHVTRGAATRVALVVVWHMLDHRA